MKIQTSFSGQSTNCCKNSAKTASETKFKLSTRQDTNKCTILLKRNSFGHKNIFALSLLIFILLTFATTRAEGQRICGSTLVDVLRTICGSRGLYNPTKERLLATYSGRRYRGMHTTSRRRYKPLAQNCCQRECQFEDLESYCNTDDNNRGGHDTIPRRPSRHGPPYGIPSVPVFPTAPRDIFPSIPSFINEEIPTPSSPTTTHHIRFPTPPQQQNENSNIFVPDPRLRNSTSESLLDRYRRLKSQGAQINIHEILKIAAELGRRRQRHHTIRPTVRGIIHRSPIRAQIDDSFITQVEH